MLLSLRQNGLTSLFEEVRSRLSFPAPDFPDPRRVPEGFQKGFLKGSLKGSRRVSEGFQKGSPEDPSKTLRKPF